MYVERLKNAVGIQSVSAWPEKRDEIVKMVKHVASVRIVGRGLVHTVLITINSVTKHNCTQNYLSTPVA